MNATGASGSGVSVASELAPSAAAPLAARDFPRLVLFAIILALASPIRLWAAVSDQGMFWPDEIFQSLEQSHRFAFGKGVIPWEFTEGVRSWLFPGFIGLVWKLASLLGMHDALSLIVLAKLMVVAVGLAGIAAGMKLGEKLGGSGGLVLAGALCAAFPGVIVYSARCMTETVSGPLIVAAAMLAIEPDAKRARLSGALVALACLLRYQCGVVAAGLLLVVLLQRSRTASVQFIIGASAVGLLGGALDWMTWGGPFHSLVAYLKFNLVEGRASEWGTSPATYYFATAWSSTGPAVLLVPLGLAAIWSRARGLVLICIAYVGVHALIPHKEFRFILPILPLALALAGAGLARIFSLLRLPQWSPALLACAIFFVGDRAALAENFGQMGQLDGNDSVSVWHANEPINRALLAAGKRDDLCGLVVTGFAPWLTGGYTYFHRDVPLFYDFRVPELAASNYLIAAAGMRVPDSYVEVSRADGVVLLRREGRCAPPPDGWTPHL